MKKKTTLAGILMKNKGISDNLPKKAIASKPTRYFKPRGEYDEFMDKYSPPPVMKPEHRFKPKNELEEFMGSRNAKKLSAIPKKKKK